MQNLKYSTRHETPIFIELKIYQNETRVLWKFETDYVNVNDCKL